MKLPGVPWPRTLLWRTFLLIVLLIGLSLFAWFQIYAHYALKPRARQAAQLVVSVVNLTRSALLASDASQRLALLQELRSLEGIRIYPAEPTDPLVPFAQGSGLMNPLQEELRARLGAHTRVTARLGEMEGFFVSFRLEPLDEEDEYWVMLPRERIARTGAAEWIGWGIAAGLLSLVGAWLLVLGVTRPLKALEHAARRVGRGELPPPLPERGPREVVAVAQAFNQMSYDLAQLESDRALILAGVSHDLRTPLARLRLGLELSASHADEIAAMSEDIEEMDCIINQFLDFARDAHAEAAQTCDVTALARETATRYAKRGAAVVLTSDETVEAVARPLALRRALANLVDNALRYAGSQSPIEIRVQRIAGKPVIEVADRGPGIPADQVERLKRPFTRLESARSNAQGSGLGLAIVERVARMHGGELALLPREGGGLLARLTLA